MPFYAGGADIVVFPFWVGLVRKVLGYGAGDLFFFFSGAKNAARYGQTDGRLGKSTFLCVCVCVHKRVGVQGLLFLFSCTDIHIFYSTKSGRHIYFFF